MNRAKFSGGRVLAIADEHTDNVIDLGSGEILSHHLIDPDKSYWRNQKREPGRWPSSRQRHMSRLITRWI